MRVKYVGPPDTNPGPELVQILEPGRPMAPGSLHNVSLPVGRELVKTRFFERAIEKQERTDVTEA